MRRRSFVALFVVLMLAASAPGLISAMQATPEPSPLATSTTAPASPEATTAPTEAPPTAASPGASPSPAAVAAACDAAGVEWTTYGGNLCNQRYSGLDQINTSNVANLKGAWTFETGVQS